MNIDPKEYEYLWSNHEIDYLFASCYLFREFRAVDFVLLYDWKKHELKFFLAKSERKRLSEENLARYKDQFAEWKDEISLAIKKGEKLVAQSDTERGSVATFAIEELKDRLQARVKGFQDLGNAYFSTEFFTLDAIERAAESDQEMKEKLHEMGEIKFAARKLLNQFYDHEKVFKPYVAEIGRRLGRNDLRWLGHAEIVDLIAGKQVSISDRDSSYWILAKRLGWKHLSGSAAEAIMQDFDEYFFKRSEKQVKGMIANKGFYQGTAKILRTVFSDKVKAEIAKVEKGDVLIANTTGPEVMDACQRAGAIVTDEGGIASHAAIVSRELGIPCVVGTHLATKTFDDGDMVEVDANTGVVKIV